MTRLALRLPDDDINHALATVNAWRDIDSVSMYSIGTVLFTSSGLAWIDEASPFGRPLLFDLNLSTDDNDSINGIIGTYLASALSANYLSINSCDYHQVGRWSATRQQAGLPVESIVAALLPEADIDVESWAQAMRGLGLTEVKVLSDYVPAVKARHPNCNIWIDELWESEYGNSLPNVPPYADWAILGHASPLWPNRPRS
jgi:hypothetical protein